MVARVSRQTHVWSTLSLMLIHFSIVAAAAWAYSEVPDTAAPRKLSEETSALLNSRLIFVYDEDGCRELEGLGSGLNMPHDYPMHRAMMLGELGRRVDEEMASRWYMQGASAIPNVRPESFTPHLPLSSIYLESLEMEITQVPDGMSLQELERLSADLPCVKYVSRDDVKFVEKSDSSSLNLRNNIRTSEDPTDPLFRYQWALKGDEGSFGIDAEGVWKNHGWHGSSDMTIAIIDSGCNLDHPDMQGQFWRNTGETDCNDGIDNDGNGLIDDCHGWDFVDEDNYPQARGTSHGTAAAGIIAAKSDNSEGVSGICWNCKLMCLRFISNTEGTVANEVRAIDYAVRMGAKISNNSYGGYAHHGSRVEQDAIERANRHGHIFVSSAGNNNLATDTSEYLHTPSGYAVGNVISVGASTENGRKTSFSNYGKRTVHAFAPGRNVISTGKEGYLVNQGTSFAAPHVAGVAALVWSRYPELSAEQVVKSLLSSCRESRDLAQMAECGGVINAPGAMKYAAELAHYPGRASMHQSHDFGQPSYSDFKFETLPDVPDVVAFEPLEIEDPEFVSLQGAHLGNDYGHLKLHGDHGLSHVDHFAPHGDHFTPLFADSPYPNVTSALSASPILDANLAPGVPRPYQDNIHSAPHGGQLGGPGIRSSSLHGGANVMTLIPLTKRLIQVPIGSAIELLNAGIDWIPNPATLASYISPTNKLGLGPAYPQLGSLGSHFPVASVEPYFSAFSLGPGPGLAASLGDGELLENVGDRILSLSGFEVEAQSSAEDAVRPLLERSSAALFQIIDS